MISFIWLDALVLISMALRDCLGTLSTACIVHEHKVLAGVFDGLCDISGVISITATGAVTLANGIGPTTFIAFAALFLGSLLGTYGGMTLSAILEQTFNRCLPQKHTALISPVQVQPHG